MYPHVLLLCHRQKCVIPSHNDSGRHSYPKEWSGYVHDLSLIHIFCEGNNDFINGENITIDGGMTKKMIYIE